MIDWFIFNLPFTTFNFQNTQKTTFFFHSNQSSFIQSNQSYNTMTTHTNNHNTNHSNNCHHSNRYHKSSNQSLSCNQCNQRCTCNMSECANYVKMTQRNLDDIIAIVQSELWSLGELLTYFIPFKHLTIMKNNNSHTKNFT